jgi:hypothetical protein
MKNPVEMDCVDPCATLIQFVEDFDVRSVVTSRQ